MIDARAPIPFRALLLSTAALVASAAHVVIDFVLGAFPVSLRGLLLVGSSAAVLYVVWVFALSRVHRGSAGAVSAASLLALWQAGLANGLAAMIACPPPVLVGGPASCPLALWQDVAHVGSFGFGVGAFFSLRKTPIPRPHPDAFLKRMAIAVLVVHLVLALIISEA